ncbi:MAG: hypothetical protein LBJ57_02415 [Prevotellaceae bacterium]|nr:hypothetical protein [Prevotellaceae bacterium]
MKNILVAAALFLCSCKVGISENVDTLKKAAPADDYRYSLLGLGAKQQKTSFLSPLFYEGVSLTTAFGTTSTRSSTMTSSCSNEHFDYLYNFSNDSKIVAIGADYTYSKYYLLPKIGEQGAFSKLFAGWSYRLELETAVKPDNQNNPVYFHLDNMAGFAFSFKSRVKSVWIFDELMIPIAGLYLGSPYSSSLPYFATEREAGFFDAFDILFINKAPQLQNTLNVDFKLNFKRYSNTVRVQYVLNMRTLHLNNNETNSIFHLFRVGYLFNTIPYAHK